MVVAQAARAVLLLIMPLKVGGLLDPAEAVEQVDILATVEMVEIVITQEIKIPQTGLAGAVLEATVML
jgi:hypothetical protein